MATQIDKRVIDFVEYLKEKKFTLPVKGVKQPERDSVVNYLYNNKTSKRKEEFLILSKAYLRKHHQLKDFDAHMSPAKSVVNTFICKRQPC